MRYVKRCRIPLCEVPGAAVVGGDNVLWVGIVGYVEGTGGREGSEIAIF